MNTTKHTTGPWKFGRGAEGTRLILGANDRYVANVQIHQTPRERGLWDEPEREANANLIIEAPELLRQRDALLEACREIANHRFISYDAASGGIYEGQYGTGVVDGHRACAFIARAAIEICEKGDK